MNLDALNLAATIIGAVFTWTASVVVVVIWLNSKFRALEKLIYREMHEHRREDDR